MSLEESPGERWRGEDDRQIEAEYNETAESVAALLETHVAATEALIARFGALGALEMQTPMRTDNFGTHPAQRRTLEAIQQDAGADARANLVAFLKDEIAKRVEE